MKILHFDETFHPNFGYQINLLSKFQAKQGHDVIIITSDDINNHPGFKSFGNPVNITDEDERFSRETDVKIIRHPIFGVISGRCIFKPGIIRIINEQHADIVMCHGNDTFSCIIIAICHKFIKSPLIFDSHMLEMASLNRFRSVFRGFFRFLIAPLYIHNQWVVFRGADDIYLEKHLGIPINQAPMLSFGSDTDRFKPDLYSRIRTRQNLEISQDAFVVIYAGKLTKEKGSDFFAKAVVKEFRTCRELIFLIIGNSPPNADVEHLFSQSQNRIIRLPTQKYSDLPQFYAAADIALFPKQVSLSFFDVQAVGLPVIASSNAINEERLSHHNGLTYLTDNVEDFREKISIFVQMDSAEYCDYRNSSINYVLSNYKYSDIAEKCTNTMLAEIDRQTNNKVKICSGR